MPAKLNPATLRRSCARHWIEAGASIVPLVPRGKEPTAGFSSRKSINTVAEARAFLVANPQANIGIVTGLKSGLVVLDVDGKEGRASLSALIGNHEALPPTTTVTTGTGRHYYFRHTGAPISGRVGHLGKGLDIRAEGNYTVGPGSIHPSGRVYRYKKGRHFNRVKPAPLPLWLLTLMTGQTGDRPVLNEATPNSPVTEGSRNTYLTSVAGNLRNTGIDEAALLAALKVVNTGKCTPPVSEAEVEKIVRSVGQYSISNPGKDAAEAIAQAVLDAHYAGGDHLIYAADGKFWAYGGRVWAPISGKTIQGQALKAVKTLQAQKNNTASLIGQVESLLKADVSTDEDKLRFKSTPPMVVNCKNGELWLGPDGTPELRAHSPSSFLRNCLDVEYLPGATCPLFDKALSEIFGKSSNPAAMAAFWHEFAGYVIQPERPIPIIVICRGAGRNGKTTLVDTLIRLLGQELVAAMRVQDLNQNQFSTSNLLGKLLFVDDDVKVGTRLPDGDLKRISEAKLISAERKFGEQFNFIVRTVPMLLCNNPPSLADLSEGMRRRLVVVPFDQTFTEKEIDRDLFKTIWATEMSGILNKALEGWTRIQQRGLKFRKPADVVRATNAWILSANPVPGFIEEKCVRSGQCSTEMLYSAFQSWSKEMGFTFTQQRPSFKKSLQSLGIDFKHTNSGDAAVGLSLKGDRPVARPPRGHWVAPGNGR
ncbi:phage/plasmid primase, P4 family [Mesorhizobium sp. M1329]|uniref:phage/plasmid primase, P4 family n=1 Tax=Mesorhizobium sp. M1329 TaxID=2957083 RepID=UPI0033385E38